LGIAVLQTTFISAVRVFGVVPNLFLIFVISVAILSGSATESAVVGFISGFVLDSMTGHLIGPNILFLMYAGVLNAIAFQRFLAGKYLGLFVTVLFTSLIYYFLEYSLNFQISIGGDMFYAFFRVMLPATVYNAIVCVPMFRLAKKWYRRAV